jgi:hypothetical protein
VFDQTSLKKDTVKRGNPSYGNRKRKPLLQIQAGETPLQRLSRENPFMPSKKKNPDKGKKLLEETKKRARLEQESRTQARLEQLDFEACEKLVKKLLKEYWDLEKELEQLAELDWSDEEETPCPLPTLTNTENKEESSSSNKFLELETPD